MTLTLLIDLDDTLLNTQLEAFVPAYFKSLAAAFAPYVDPAQMLRALVAGTTRMNENEDFARTLLHVFEDEFYAQAGASRESLAAVVENYYDHIFAELAPLTAPIAEARPFVDWARAQGDRIAIATDPLLPRKATLQRLQWAGFEADEFDIVSTVEDFHFSKSHPEYYAELLGRIGWPNGAVLMVGNDPLRDIAPAQMLGLRTFLIEAVPGPRSGEEARGTLSQLRAWIESAPPQNFIPSYKSREAVLAILRATPAALLGLTTGLESPAWKFSAAADDWSMTELICHLRDTEREVHHVQIKLFDQAQPFIPRPDTAVWASQRDYVHEDGAGALREFVNARRETLAMLQDLAPERWDRKARHAIFGPTNFLEIVNFIGDHDRLHIQQGWGLLKKRGKQPA